MKDEDRKAVYEQALKMLKPAFERVVADPAFRERLEAHPLEALDEVGVELDEATRSALEGRRFSEYWAERRKEVEGPVEIRDLPPDPEQGPEQGELSDQHLEAVAGGFGLVLGKGPVPSYAPPYVPVGPVIAGDNIATPGHVAAKDDELDLKRRE